MGGKGLEVAELVVEERMEDIEVDVQVAVHQHVSESRDTPKFPYELVGQHTEASELVDRARVVRNIAAPAGGDVGCDVERILGAQLEPAFYQPTLLGVSVELFEGYAAASREHLERLSKRGQVPADDLNVDFTGTHDHRSET